MSATWIARERHVDRVSAAWVDCYRDELGLAGPEQWSRHRLEGPVEPGAPAGPRLEPRD